MSYHIVSLSVEGTTKLETYPTYSDAENAFDGWCGVYPHAYIEIFSDADLTYANQYND
jgi:hypothetical protein